MCNGALMNLYYSTNSRGVRGLYKSSHGNPLTRKRFVFLGASTCLWLEGEERERERRERKREKEREERERERERESICKGEKIVLTNISACVIFL